MAWPDQRRHHIGTGASPSERLHSTTPVVTKASVHHTDVWKGIFFHISKSLMIPLKEWTVLKISLKGLKRWLSGQEHGLSFLEDQGSIPPT